MNRNNLIYPLFLASLLLCNQASCAENDDSFSGAVIESMNAGGYTYVQVDTGAGRIWAAGPAADIKAGDKVTISRLMPMANYHSNSLDRDFDVLYFVGGFSGESAGSSHTVSQAHANAGSQTDAVTVTDIRKAEGGKNIAEIIEQQEQLAEQRVKVRGQVVKYNPHIMGKDWIHIRDTSTDEDLTITANADVTPGDVILAHGKIVLNKDFGYGYVYEIMMEDAEVIVEE